MPSRREAPLRRSPAWLLPVLALVLILAAGLRFYRIDAQSLWYDEGVSLGEARATAGQILRDAAADIHPPGYYLLLAGWQNLTGSSELALRMFSALFSVLAVALVYAVGLHLFDRSTGVWSALFVAVNPFHIWYGQEVRMYALLEALSASSILLTVLILSRLNRAGQQGSQPQRAFWLGAGYVLVNAAGLYTHYTFPFVIVGETLAFLLWLSRRRHKLSTLALWAGLQIATLLLYTPWLPPAYRQLTTYPRVAPQNVTLMQLVSTLAYGTTTPLEAAQVGLIPLALLVGVGLFPPVEDDGHPLRFSERAGLALMWLLVPVAIPLMMGVIREPFLRFFLPCSLPLWILAARGVGLGFRLGVPVAGSNPFGAALTRVIIIILSVSSLVPVMTGLRNLYANPDYARDDYRGIAQRILSEAGPDAVVILDAPGQYGLFSYYFPGTNIVPLPNEHTDETLARLIRENERLYVVYYGEQEQDPEGIVAGTLAERAFVVSDEWYGHVRLVRYVIPAHAASEIQTPSGARFGGSIVLEGFTLSTTTLTAGEALGVTLFWTAEQPPAVRYRVFVHLYRPDSDVIAAQHDGEPGGNLAPTDEWVVGQRVADNHGLLLPLDSPPGIYRLMIGLYDSEGNRLPITLNGQPLGDRLLLAEIVVE
jgi:mannosyltransferase